MDFAPAIEFYEAALASGKDAGTEVGWLAGEGYQIANFVALCEELDDGATVLDVGCGTGALVDYLARIGRRVEYVGVDISEKMIETARARHPGVVFEQRDILVDPPTRRFDFVVCSGTLNFAIPDHTRWVSEMIARMYELADRAALINLLSALALPGLRSQLTDKNEYVRYVPEEIVRFARRLCPDVRLTNASASTFEVVLQRPRANTLAALARSLGVTSTESPALRGVVDYAWRRRLFGELRDLLRTIEPTAFVLEQLARACVRTGEIEEAIAMYERAAALAPTKSAPCTGAGRLHFEAVRDAEAQTCFREALAREPSDPDARYGLVLSLMRSRQPEEARTVALATPPGAVRELLDGKTSTDPQQAIAAYERSLELAPRFLDAIAALASAREFQARWSEAAALWERALALVVDDVPIRQRLVQARSRIVPRGD